MGITIILKKSIWLNFLSGNECIEAAQSFLSGKIIKLENDECIFCKGPSSKIYNYVGPLVMKYFRLGAAVQYFGLGFYSLGKYIGVVYMYQFYGMYKYVTPCSNDFCLMLVVIRDSAKTFILLCDIIAQFDV